MFPLQTCCPRLHTQMKREITMFDIFQNMASILRKYKGSPCLVFDGVQYTYQELFLSALGLSAYLKDQKLQRALVPIDLDNDFSFYVSILGVVLSGNGFCSLGRDWPRAKKQEALRLLGSNIILSNKVESDLDPKLQFVNVASLFAQVGTIDSKAFDIQTTRDQIVYGIFTSGSSGKAKYSLIQLDALENLVKNQLVELEILGSDRIVQFSPREFDAFIWEFFATICSGATLYVPSRGIKQNPILLGRFIVQHSITIATLPPAFAALMKPRDFHSLRTLIFAGEPFGSALIRRCARENLLIINAYGLTEGSVCSTLKRNPEHGNNVGKPIGGVEVYVLTPKGEVLIAGEVGEIGIAGVSLAKNLPITTCKIGEHKKLIYLTGDLGFWDERGDLIFCGRKDRQVKLLGNRVNLDRLDLSLMDLPEVCESRSLLIDGENTGRIVSYVKLHDPSASTKNLLDHLHQKLEYFELPSDLLIVKSLPLTSNGKYDDRQLEQYNLSSSMSQNLTAGKTLQEKLISAWCAVLHIDDVELDENFFDAGGTSLSILELFDFLSSLDLPFSFDVIDLFQYPTVRSFVEHFSEAVPASSKIHQQDSKMPGLESETSSKEVAVVGYSYNFSGIESDVEFWDLITGQCDAITREENQHTSENSDLVRAAGLIKKPYEFDRGGFGWSEEQATKANPQLRLALMHIKNALGLAGYEPGNFPRQVNVYASCSDNEYARYTADKGSMHDLSSEKTLNSPNFFATQIAFAFDFRGAALNINTACSSSLISVVEASHALRAGLCDVAIIVSASVILPEKYGYRRRAGATLSPDGVCRPFSPKANGTVPGSGVGVLVLKRYEDACRAGNEIDAVIKGVACNNDGKGKVGYAAPSPNGQTECIRMAMEDSKINPADIAYLEAHGTGTDLGDRIELKAIKDAYQYDTEEVDEWAGLNISLGAVKAYIGHLDVCSGIAGLIKVILMFKASKIPSQLDGFSDRELALMGFEGLHVPKKPFEWPKDKNMAGVSSFGIGGTNAHIIIRREKIGILSKFRYTGLSKKNTLKDYCAAWLYQSAQDYAVKSAQEISVPLPCLVSKLNRFSHRQDLNKNTKVSDLELDSLAVLDLVAEIDREAGVKIPISCFYDDGKLGDLFSRVQNNFAQTTLELLRKGVVGRVLIFLPPGNGLLLNYHSLLRGLKFEGNIYGISSPIDDKVIAKFQRFEELASYYLELIIPLHGSAEEFIFAGWSYGASVAYEMTKQFQKHAANIKLLLIEGWRHQPPTFFDKKRLYQAGKLLYKKLGGQILIKEDNFLELFIQRISLLNAYVPSKVENTLIHLIKAMEVLPEYSAVDSPVNGWDGFIDKRQCVRVAGDHESIFKGPNRLGLLRAINNFLLNNQVFD